MSVAYTDPAGQSVSVSVCVCLCMMTSHLPWQSDARHGDEGLGEGGQLRTDLLHLQLQASTLSRPLLQTDVHLQYGQTAQVTLWKGHYNS